MGGFPRRRRGVVTSGAVAGSSERGGTAAAASGARRLWGASGSEWVAGGQRRSALGVRNAFAWASLRCIAARPAPPLFVGLRERCRSPQGSCSCAVTVSHFSPARMAGSQSGSW